MKNMESNVGKWNGWFGTEPLFFGKTITYKLGHDYLKDCEVVEDWGTGGGAFKTLRTDAIGVDGSDSPFAEKKFVDLTEYKSKCDGIFMRHVLEHNYEWKKILRNVIESADKKICIVMFIPFSSGEDKELAYNTIGVPDLSISKRDFYDILQEYPNIKYNSEIYKTQTQCGHEEVIYIVKDEI